MINSKKAIGSDIDAMKSMKDFISVYEEIAANKMRLIRDAVVKRRDFLAELTNLYNEIKTSYKKEVELFLSKKNPRASSLSFLKKNGKTVRVFFSTNASFYGDIVKNTFALFKEQYDREKSDVVVVGKTGKRFLDIYMPGVEYTYFDFPDMSMDMKLLKPVVLHIAAYEKIIIFHPKFQTLVRQTPTASSSAGTAVITAYETERTITSPFITKDSLIYLTAASDTQGLIPYIARQTEKNFTIAIPYVVNKDIKINWWIVN